MTGSDKDRARRPATQIVRSGRDPFAHHEFVNPPVYRGSTVLFKTVESFEKRNQRYIYGRRGTPTSEALEEAIAKLEGGARTWLAPSGGGNRDGTALLHQGRRSHPGGGHRLSADAQDVRGRAETLWRRDHLLDPTIGAGIARLMQPNTTLVFTESPGSLTFEVQDIPAIAAAAHGRTHWWRWTTPGPVRSISSRSPAASTSRSRRRQKHRRPRGRDAGRNHGHRAPGARWCSRPWDWASAPAQKRYLGLRGFRTVDVRLERHWRSGVEIARWLEQRPEVARVLHPAVPSHPQHELWKRDYLGAAGLFSIVRKPCAKPALAAMLEGLELSAWAPRAAASNVWCCPSTQRRYGRTRPGSPKGPRCGCLSGSRMSET